MKKIKYNLMNLLLIGIWQSTSSRGMENNEETQSSHVTIKDTIQTALSPSLAEEEKNVNTFYEANYKEITKLNPIQCDNIEQNALNNQKYASLLIRTGDINKFPQVSEKIIKDANQGCPIAQNNLGAMYEDGKGVDQNYIEAVKWYRLAVNQGDAAAQRKL